MSEGDRKDRKYLEDLDSDGRVVLKWILQKEDSNSWSGLVPRFHNIRRNF